MAGKHFSHAERLQEFYARLQALSAANSFYEAVAQMTDTLNQVENEMTDIPYNPLIADPKNKLEPDGRMYPPELGNFKVDSNSPDVQIYRHARHSTLIGSNGSIKIIIRKRGEVAFEKAGANGKRVEEV